MDKKKLINESMDYMLAHLEEELTVEAVAQHFFLSKYYFSRMFKAETGESVYAFMKRCKVDQSAVDMKMKPQRSITDIGMDYGYSASNYSTLFRKQHVVSPAAYRQALPTDSMPVPFTPERTAHFKSYEEYDKNIEIVNRKDVFVIYERFVGNYEDIEANWHHFLASNNNYYTENTVLYERYFNDPTVTNANQCICDLCMQVDGECSLSNTMRIEFGKCAVFHYEGKILDIFESVQGVFTVWLVQSQYYMRGNYAIHMYKHIDWDNHYVGMDLCIPIQ